MSRDSLSVSAVAHPNIAFIKYWGNRDNRLRLPVNGSISMNLGALATKTKVTFSPSYPRDALTVNGMAMSDAAAERVSEVLDEIRRLSGRSDFADVVSETNFPLGVGIASSAAAFSALALAAAGAAGLELKEAGLSRLARLGSGSACRSVPGGFCEWKSGGSDEDSIAHSIAPADHWHLVDLIAIFSTAHKKVGSSAGHPSAATSPYQEARVLDAPRRIQVCREAILTRDFDRLAIVSEEDSTMMHCVMMTQRPALFYWEPGSLALMKAVPAWRAEGLAAFYTLDAGPNVHVICEAGSADEVEARIRAFPTVQDVIRSGAGGPAHVVSSGLILTD